MGEGLFLTLLLALIPGCSCATAHELDASLTDTNTDAGPDAWICDPNPPAVGACSPDADARCLAWAMSLAPPGTFGRSRCVEAASGCVRGDWADLSDPLHPAWGCSPTTVCRDDEVCVSDTPTGPTRCERICGTASFDAGPGPRDTGAPRLYDGNVPDARCDNRVVTFPSCTPANVELCAVRAAAASGGHFPHVTCGPSASLPGTSTCIAADACDDAGLCFCNATRVCATNEVCVSDTPDGERYCVAACGI